MLDIVKAITPWSWLGRAEEVIFADEPEQTSEIVRIPATLELGSRTISCTIVELSPRTACIYLDEGDSEHGAFIGQHGLLRPYHGRPISTAVRWFTDRSLSLRFTAPVNLSTFSDSIDRFREGTPRMGRAEVDIPTQIISGCKGTKGTIQNISCGGALIRTNEPFRHGESIMLETDLLRPIGGYVRWRKDRQMGVMFNRLLPVESAEIISDFFGIHPIWLEEISDCHHS